MTSKKDVDELEALAEYDSEDEGNNQTAAADAAADAAGGDASAKGDRYVAIHSSGFREFLLKPELSRAIVDAGFEHPSGVQQECIPQSILGNDVLCQAKSGMGKTAVFVLSVLQQLDISPTDEYDGVKCVVMCHTRELAFQICHEFDRFRKYLPHIKTAVFYGGIPVAQNLKLIEDEPPHIVIGTPGRMNDLVNEQKKLDLSKVKHFVIDECDAMLSELDMRRTVQKVFKATPPEKQVMMFTATLPEELKAVCKKFMHSPLEVLVNDGSKLTLHGLVQYYVSLTEAQKNRKLVDILDSIDLNQAVIFVSKPRRAQELAKLLQDCNFPCLCIYGRMKQEERIKTYQRFKNFESRILVATDLFGRGIDVERVNVTIQYDMAADADQFLHRVGRAGRFGTKGLAISFVTTEEDKTVLSTVQSRFAVKMEEMPESIDSSTYMNA